MGIRTTVNRKAHSTDPSSATPLLCESGSRERANDATDRSQAGLR